MNFLKPASAVVLFFYRFIVGDDPLVASVLVLALIATEALVKNGFNAWWLVPPVAVLMTGLSLWRQKTT